MSRATAARSPVAAGAGVAVDPRAVLRALLAAAEAAREVVAAAVDVRRRETEARLGVAAGDDRVLLDAEFGRWLDRYGDVAGILAAAGRVLADWPAGDRS